MDSVTQIEKLINEFHENINSHVFLLETNNVELCLKDVKNIIKDKIKADSNVARQIDEETYLELIVIRPEDKEIKKNQISSLQERIKLKPILSEYIFYVITPAEALSEISSNKLLKTIEEPNENIIAFLITRNSDLILPTIKSRCEHININYNTEIETTNDNFPELLNQVNNLIYSIENKDHITFTHTKSDNIVRENCKSVENIIKDYYNMACGLNNCTQLDKSLLSFIQKNNTYYALIKKAKYLNKIDNKLTGNMNSDLLLEKIYFELKEVK